MNLLRAKILLRAMSRLRGMSLQAGTVSGCGDGAERV